MHSFVAAVLLGMCGLDQLGIHTEPDPPHAELRQPRQCAGGERDTVVRAQNLGQAILLKEPLKDRAALVRGGASEAATLEEVATEAILYREREAVPAIAE